MKSCQPIGGSSKTCVLTALAAKEDRKSTRLNSSHANISYAVFCLKKKTRCTRQAGREATGRASQLGDFSLPIAVESTPGWHMGGRAERAAHRLAGRRHLYEHYMTA